MSMKQDVRQKGFSAVVAIVIILVVAAIGIGGWYVWDKNQRDNTKPNDKTSQNAKKQNSEEGESSDPSEGGKYLVIEGWGVRFPLPEELKGDILTYKSSTEVSGTILFASRELNSLTGDDTCNFVKQPDGSYAGGIQASLSRINPATYPKDALEAYRNQLDYIKELDDYDYYSRKSKSPPITCLTNQHEEFNDVEQSISDQLRQAFKELERIE